MLKKRTISEKLKNLFGLGKAEEELYDELEEILIQGDIGPRVAMKIIDELKEKKKKVKIKTREDYTAALKGILSGYLLTNTLVPVTGRLNFYLILGVNGVGKTTTIAKLAHYYRKHHGIEKIILSAADTFRAAAIEQLHLHGERLNLKVISQETGSDPGAVIFDSLASAKAKSIDLVLADTAGRMHTKTNLVKELEKVNKIIQRDLNGGEYKKVLVIDSTTGQNAYSQAEIFHQAIGIDSIIMAKYDSTAKGGIVISMCDGLKIPFSFMGTGEKPDDLVPFDRDMYLESLIGST
ncbi:MAG: signal recognition particle-docking protein FtsY [Spirochaetales bacterium]|nr:signal recognition particle-docking protein FtsY [Spirochaetales bacterium]